MIKMKKKAFKLFEKIYGNLFRFNSEGFFEWENDLFDKKDSLLSYSNSKNLENRVEKLYFLKQIRKSKLLNEFKKAFKETSKLAEVYNYKFKFDSSGNFYCDEMFFLAPIFNKIVRVIK